MALVTVVAAAVVAAASVTVVAAEVVVVASAIVVSLLSPSHPTRRAALLNINAQVAVEALATVEVAVVAHLEDVEVTAVVAAVVEARLVAPRVERR